MMMAVINGAKVNVLGASFKEEALDLLIKCEHGNG